VPRGVPLRLLLSEDRTHVGRGGYLINHARRLLPGIVLCIAITVAATLLEAVEVHFVGQPYLEALVLAILLGVVIRTVWKPDPRWTPGIDVSAKFVLECAIVMLGASRISQRVT
jgi:uncharacterized membrane protein YadS